jgi:hypothetical protein
MHWVLPTKGNVCAVKIPLFSSLLEIIKIIKLVYSSMICCRKTFKASAGAAASTSQVLVVGILNC